MHIGIDTAWKKKKRTAVRGEAGIKTLGGRGGAGDDAMAKRRSVQIINGLKPSTNQHPGRGRGEGGREWGVNRNSVWCV